MKTWKLTVNEDELKALINHHRFKTDDTTVETSARIHDLTKRLNKETPEIEKDEPQQVAAETQQPTTSGW
jgi:hypothetical protein